MPSTYNSGQKDKEVMRDELVVSDLFDESIASLCKPIEKIVITDINDKTFSFCAHLGFHNKENKQMKFEPMINDTWNINDLPILRANVSTVLFQLQQEHR